MPPTFSPASKMSPEVGRSRQPIRLIRVDFPEPEGPIMASHSPGSTWSEMWLSARMTPPFSSAFAGYALVTSVIRIISLTPQNNSRLHPPQKRDRRRRRQQRGPGCAEHASLGLHDLPQRTNLSRGELPGQPRDGGVDLLRRSVDRDLNRRGLDPGPGLECRQVQINAAIFGGTGLKNSSGRQVDRASLEAEVEWLAGTTYQGSGARTDQRRTIF